MTNSNLKILLCNLLIITLLLSFSGCTDKNKAESVNNTLSLSELTDKKEIKFTDDLGTEITVKNPERVASMLGSFADMWLLAGGNICATADDAWEDLKLDLSDDTVNIGSAHRPNKEKILSANPDFIIASSKLAKQVELKEDLKNAGITAAYFDVKDFESYLKVLKLFTDITGNKEAFKKYGTEQKDRIEKILERNKGQKPQDVLVLRASASSIRAKNSDSTMLGGMLKDFGCNNIADSDSMLLENLNIESIAEMNPQKIFLVQTGDDLNGIKVNVEKMFNENPLWQQLDAVKTGKVYYMDKKLYNMKPNARFAEAYEKLEKILYEK